MRDGLISVIIPVYRAERYLERCYASLRRQTYAHFELIFVDDGSPDASGRLCDEFASRDARVKVVHGRNKGVAVARNIGTRLAIGEYVTFVDSDDWVEPEYLAHLHLLLSRFPQADYSECSISERWDGIGHVMDSSGLETCYNGCAAADSLLYGDHLYTAVCAKLFRRSLFEQVRFREGCVYEDMYFIADILSRVNAVAYSAKPLYVYDVHPGSITTTPDLSHAKMHYDSAEALCRTVEARFGVEMKSAVRRYMTYARLRLLRNLLACGEKEPGLDRKLRREIMSTGWPVVLDRRASLRDKLGVLSVFPGVTAYGWAWKIYTALRGKAR